MVSGDFNRVLNREEKIRATVRRRVSNCGLEDMKSTSCYYTWNNKQSEMSRVFCKLDRVMCNDNRSDTFPTAETWFLLEGLFDHSPCYLRASGKEGWS